MKQRKNRPAICLLISPVHSWSKYQYRAADRCLLPGSGSWAVGDSGPFYSSRVESVVVVLVGLRLWLVNWCEFRFISIKEQQMNQRMKSSESLGSSPCRRWILERCCNLSWFYAAGPVSAAPLSGAHPPAAHPLRSARRSGPEARCSRSPPRPAEPSPRNLRN